MVKVFDLFVSSRIAFKAVMLSMGLLSSRQSTLILPDVLVQTNKETNKNTDRQTKKRKGKKKRTY